MNGLSRFAHSLLGFTALVLVWEVLAVSHPQLCPHLPDIARALAALLREPASRLDFLSTLGRTLLAFLTAVAIGIPCGVAVGAIPRVEVALRGPLDALRSIPGFVLLPVALAVFQKGELARWATAAFGAMLLVLASTAFAIAHVRPLRTEVARLYGAGRAFIVFGVIAREVAAPIADACRLALSQSLILVIALEVMLGARHGLGTRVNDSLSAFNLPDMYALILLIGLLGYGLNLLARMLTTRVTRSSPHL